MKNRTLFDWSDFLWSCRSRCFLSRRVALVSALVGKVTPEFFGRESLQMANFGRESLDMPNFGLERLEMPKNLSRKSVHDCETSTGVGAVDDLVEFIIIFTYAVRGLLYNRSLFAVNFV